MSERTDRELLELAAKAAGIATDGPASGSGLLVLLPYRGTVPVFGEWNPLANDGDALALAVKLELPLHHSENFAIVYAGTSVASPSCAERVGGDRLAATRRAIVRAAAEIGAKP